MVNDLLDISRMELKTKQLEIKELDLVEIIKSTIEFLEFEIEKKKIKTIFNPPAEFPKIKADQSQISRLFTNLISNAIKYNKEEGEIRIRLRVDGKYAVVEVEDTGIGMSEKEKANLFSEFYRIKNEKTRGIPGTGLGLSIVKRIVETYSGKIEVVSEPNKGSNFIVYLPISR
jgi:two-component system phosphate regulon sensor histidine kinase PhoR